MVSNLLVKAFLGFAFLMLVLAVALFIPAGSLNYWQAWVYLAVWVVCVILIIVVRLLDEEKLGSSDLSGIIVDCSRWIAKSAGSNSR